MTDMASTWGPARVVHLTSVHRADDTRIFRKECRTLANAGYEVVLIAATRGSTRRVEDGVIIQPVYQASSRSERIRRTLREVYLAAKAERARVYHLHDPELIPVGLALKLRGAKVVYDVHEDSPADILDKDWIPRPARRTVARATAGAEWLASRQFDLVVAATPAIARRFPTTKTVVVQNFPDLTAMPSPGGAHVASSAGAVYVGDITEMRGARHMVRAMAHTPPELNATLTLAGRSVPPDLIDEILALPGGERTNFVGWLSAGEVTQLLERSSVGLVVFHPNRNNLEAQPNKLFEYMAAGLPVIASDFPLWRDIITGSNCGVLVDPLDPHAIGDAIEKVLRDSRTAATMGSNGRRAVDKTYNWASQATRLVQAYRRLTAPE